MFQQTRAVREVFSVVEKESAVFTIATTSLPAHLLSTSSSSTADSRLLLNSITIGLCPAVRNIPAQHSEASILATSLHLLFHLLLLLLTI